jgi:hypothetical protein
MSIVRSCLSVLGGFFVAAVMVGITTAVASTVMLGGMEPGIELTPAYLSVNLVYSAGFAVLGGYVTATVADHSEVAHAAGLGALFFVMGLGTLAFNGWQPLEGQPAWYPWALALLMPLFAVAGGKIVVRRMKAGPVRYSRRAEAADHRTD